MIELVAEVAGLAIVARTIGRYLPVATTAVSSLDQYTLDQLARLFGR